MPSYFRFTWKYEEDNLYPIFPVVTLQYKKGHECLILHSLARNLKKPTNVQPFLCYLEVLRRTINVQPFKCYLDV